MFDNELSRLHRLKAVSCGKQVLWQFGVTRAQAQSAVDIDLRMIRELQKASQGIDVSSMSAPSSLSEQ